MLIKSEVQSYGDIHAEIRDCNGQIDRLAIGLQSTRDDLAYHKIESSVRLRSLEDSTGMINREQYYVRRDVHDSQGSSQQMARRVARLETRCDALEGELRRISDGSRCGTKNDVPHPTVNIPIIRVIEPDIPRPSRHRYRRERGADTSTASREVIYGHSSPSLASASLAPPALAPEARRRTHCDVSQSYGNPRFTGSWKSAKSSRLVRSENGWRRTSDSEGTPRPAQGEVPSARDIRTTSGRKKKKTVSFEI